MQNSTSPRSEGVVWLDDRKTGESFRVVKSQIEKDGSKTLVVTSSALSVEITELSVKIKARRQQFGKPKLFVLLLGRGMSMLADTSVTQYEKAVFVALVRGMSYGNVVQATLMGLADVTGIQKQNISRALKALQNRGAIKRVDPEGGLIAGVPTYEVNPELVFRGSFSDAMRRKEIDRYQEICLAVERSREVAEPARTSRAF